jgi:NADH:ubiquinone oxidoreductase subunit 4 (subunit M)
MAALIAVLVLAVFFVGMYPRPVVHLAEAATQAIFPVAGTLAGR